MRLSEAGLVARYGEQGAAFCGPTPLIARDVGAAVAVSSSR
jgi:hypothetical protein